MAKSLTPIELRDHAHDLLSAIVDDLATGQTAAAASEKSEGRGLKRAMQVSGELHAAARIAHRFNASQVLAEFRALQASVVRLYAVDGGEADLDGVQRFNEAIDEALTASVECFSVGVEKYRDQFTGMLSHDLRAPLNAITVGVSLLAVPGEMNADRRFRVASPLLNSAHRMARMIADLLDLTRTRLGGGIPITRKPVDLQEICQEVALEIKTVHPDATVDCRHEGDLRGDWDRDRLTQVVSNLIGNALQHGDGTGVRVVADGSANDVALRVHNHGRAIPADVQASMFEPLARYEPRKSEIRPVSGWGCSLRAIVRAHGGTITLSSTEEAGTTFEVRPLGATAASRNAEQP